MPSNEMKISVQGMRDYANEIEKLNSSMRNSFEAIQSAINRLNNQGDAARALQEAGTKMGVKFEAFTDVVKKGVATLNERAAAMEATESKAKEVLEKAASQY